MNHSRKVVNILCDQLGSNFTEMNKRLLDGECPCSDRLRAITEEGIQGIALIRQLTPASSERELYVSKIEQGLLWMQEMIVAHKLD